MTISEYLKQNGAVASTPTATQSQSTGKMGSFVAAQNIKPAQTAKDVSTQSALAEKLSIKKAAQTTTPKATQTTTTTPSALSAWEQTHVPASARQSFVEPTTQEVTGGISDWLSKWRERSAATAAQNTAAADALRAQATPEIETPTTGNRATDIARAASEQYLHALDDPKATEMGRFGNIFNAATNNTLAGFLNTIGLVTSQGEANIPEDVASLVGTVAPELTNNAFSQAARDKMQGVSEKAYNSADTLSQQAAENTTMAKDGLGTIGSLLTDAGIAGVQMAGDIGLAALTGGSALAPMGVRAFGMGAQQARQDGANEREQFIYGIGSAAVEMLTEKIASVSTPFKAYGKGTLDDIIEGLIGKLGKTSGGKAVLKALASAVSEGGEEAISDLVNPLLQKLTYNPDALQQYGDKEYWSNMLNDALVGGALGLVGSTGDVINTARTPTVATDTNVPTTPQNTIAPNLPKTTAVESTQTASDVSGIPTLGNAQTRNSLTPTLTNQAQNESYARNDAADENSIKSGVGIVSGLPIKYVPDLKAEARNWHDYIEVGDKFFNLDSEGQAEVLAHEVQHTLAQNLYNGDSTLFEAIMRNPAFGETKTAPNGRVYWEGIFGDVGSNSVDETFTQSLAVCERNPQWMQERHPEAYEFIKQYKSAQRTQAPVTPESSVGAAEGGLPSGVGAMSNPFSAERKVSEVYSNTLKNTDILDDVQKSQLEARDYEFDSVSEKESVAKAQQRLQVDFDGEVADLSAMQSYTAAEDVDTAMGILGAFAQDGEIKGDFTAMKQWSKDLYSKIHQSAVTLQAMDKYSRTPEGAVIKAQQAVFQAEQKMTTKKENGKTVQTSIGRKISSDIDNVTKIVDALVNGKPTTGMAQTLNKVKLKDVKELVASGTYDVEAIADLVRSKYGIPTLTTADVQKIYEFTKMADEAKTDYDRRKFLNLSARIVADKMPVTFKNKVLAVRRIAMLMNPKTLISRNAGGNLVFGLFEDIKDAPGTAIDILVSAKTGQRTTSYNPFATTKAEFLGAKKGLTEWGKDIKNGVDTSPTSHEMPRSTALKSKVGAGAEKALYNLLGLGDRPFFEAAYAKRIDELKRLGLDYTSDDAVVQATAYALERVFQNNSVLAQKAMELRESLGVLGDIAIPYVQTPANIIDKLIDASPYGFVRAVKKAGTINDSAWSQKQFVDTLARAMTGTGIITLAFFLCRNGLITGGEPDNEDEGLTYQNKISGWQPYSINFGDKSYTYDWANPIGTLLALGADISQSKSAEDTLTAILMAGLKAGINTMFNQSYLEGLSEIFGQDDIAGGLETMLINLPASFTPTAFQQIARLIDPIARDTYDTDPLKRSWNKVIAKIPWASKKLPAKIGANGQEMTNFGGSLGSNILESLLSPGYIGETTTTKVDDEVQRLYAVTGETSVFPDWSEYTSKSDFSLNANGEKYTTTTAEWERYQKTRGTTAYQLISSVLNTAAYRSLSNTEKADLISDINAYSNDQAKRTILKSRGETYSSAWDAEAAISRESGIPVTTYLIYENAVSNFSADKDKNGNSISGSKKSKVVDYISSLNLTDKQKDYLYLAEGYADSGLGDAPWNKD